MNQIHPKKLLNSKWTAVAPQNKEKHFLITKIKFDEEGEVIHCELEAVMTKRSELIDWNMLKNSDNWLLGWK